MRTTAAQAIRRRARVLRQNLWMILGVGFAFAVIGNITEPAPENRYLAGAQVDTGGVQEQVLLVYQYAAKPDPLKVQVAQAAETALSREVLTNAAVRLGSVPDAADLEISASQAGFTGRVGISVEASDPRRAAQVANVVAEEFAKLRNREYRLRIEDISRELRAARSSVGIPPQNTDILASLIRYGTEQYQNRVDLLKRFAEPAIVGRRATVPTAPVPVLPWAGMIFLLGIGLAITAAFLREAIRARREDPVLAAETAGCEPLGRLDDAGVAPILAFASEAQGSPVRIAVCGLRPGARPTATATAVACAYANQGRRTVLVEADTHRPLLAGHTGLARRPGVVELLAGTAGADEVLQATTDGNGHPGPATVVAGGPAPGPPTGTAPALDAVAVGADVQVVVVPTPLESAELALLAPVLDLVVVVAEQELRGEDELEAIGRALRPLGLRAGLALVGRAMEDELVRGALLSAAGGGPAPEPRLLSGVAG